MGALELDVLDEESRGDEFLAQSSTNFYGKRRCENFYILQPKSKYTYETKGIMQFS